MGSANLIDLAKDGPEWPSVTLATTGGYLAQNRQTALGVVRAYSRAVARFKTDRDFAVQVLKKYLQIDDTALAEDTRSPRRSEPTANLEPRVGHPERLF